MAQEIPAHSLNAEKREFSFSPPPLAESMFHAVADRDVEAMVRLYASSCRDTIALRQSSSLHQSFQQLHHNMEEKESSNDNSLRHHPFLTQILRDLTDIIQNPHSTIPSSQEKEEKFNSSIHSEGVSIQEDKDAVMEDATTKGSDTLNVAMFLPETQQHQMTPPLIPQFLDDDMNIEETLTLRPNSIYTNPRLRINSARYRAWNYDSYSSQSSSSFSNNSRNMCSNRWESSQDVDRALFGTARHLTNTHPASSFVVYNTNRNRGQEQIKEGQGDDERVPIYDGAVANSTPIGGGILRGGGGGSGTILHLAIALDCPLSLAILLVMGGDVMSRHTNFRRLILHEAACANSSKCLTLLLSFGNSTSRVKEKGKKKYLRRFLPEWTQAWHESGYKINARGEDDGMKAAFDRDHMQSPNEFELEDSPRRLSFVKVLHIILDINEKVKRNELSDLDAAFLLLSKVPISSVTRKILRVSTRFQSILSLDRESSKDEPSFMECQVDGHGNTPLHWAAFKNSVQCLSILLSHQADPNVAAQPSGWTPLHDAAYSDSADSIPILIEAGACVDAQAHSGATPLCFAAQEDAPNATRLLLEANANPSIRCEGIGSDGSTGNYSSHHNRFSGYTPLHYCAHYNAYHAARVLINYSMKTKACDVAVSPLLEIPELNGKLPIHVAVLRGSSDVLKELLHGGAHIDKHKVNSGTLLPQREYNMVEDDTSSVNTEDHDDLSNASDVRMSPVPHNNSSAIVTPTSSPVLKALIPQVPITSNKPWNCISQRSIDQCKALLNETEQNWTPERHSIFHPRDRLAVTELLRVGKRLEQMGTGIFRELWPLILSFCGREWFEPERSSAHQLSGPMRTEPDNLSLPGPLRSHDPST